MNKLMTAYLNVVNRLHEDDGAEAIEWIAMVAVILVLLLAAEPLFRQGGTTIAGEIVSAISNWIAKFTG